MQLSIDLLSCGLWCFLWDWVLCSYGHCRLLELMHAKKMLHYLKKASLGPMDAFGND